MGNLNKYEYLTFVDIETTSLDASKGEIVQICILTEKADGSIEEWTTKIKPKLLPGTWNSKALEINGYSEEKWKDAPEFKDVVETIIRKMSLPGPIIGHNVKFDLGFIESSIKRYTSWTKGRKTDFNKKEFSLGRPSICTQGLAWIALPPDRQNLKVVREHLNISEEGAHDATKDTYDCREVFWHCINRITKGKLHDYTA